MLDKFQSLKLLIPWTVGLQPPKLYAVPAEVTELNNRKKLLEDALSCHSEDNHEARITKREKVKKRGSNMS